MLIYIGVLLLAAAVYLGIFYIVFTAFFKVAKPSAEVFILNFIMAATILLLMPVIIEVVAFARSLAEPEYIDAGYIIKKLDKIAIEDVDPRELARFLKRHLHLSYVGFLVEGRLYGSKQVNLSDNELGQIGKLAASDGQLWLNFQDSTVRGALAEAGVDAIANLIGPHGRSYGQVLVSGLFDKKILDRRSLIQLEMTINLAAVIIYMGEEYKASKKQKAKGR